MISFKGAPAEDVAQHQLLGGQAVIASGLAQGAGARVAMSDVNIEWLAQTANDLREVGGDD